MINTDELIAELKNEGFSVTEDNIELDDGIKAVISFVKNGVSAQIFIEDIPDDMTVEQMVSEANKRLEEIINR